MPNSTARIFGLFELDTAGTVMYSKVDPHTSSVNPATSLIGRNFFDELASFENVAEIHQRFRYFAKGSDAAEKFTFTYLYERQPVAVKVMLMQISQREYDERGKVIIVDIIKV